MRWYFLTPPPPTKKEEKCLNLGEDTSYHYSRFPSFDLCAFQFSIACGRPGFISVVYLGFPWPASMCLWVCGYYYRFTRTDFWYIKLDDGSIWLEHIVFHVTTCSLYTCLYIQRHTCVTEKIISRLHRTYQDLPVTGCTTALSVEMVIISICNILVHCKWVVSSLFDLLTISCQIWLSLFWPVVIM